MPENRTLDTLLAGAYAWRRFEQTGVRLALCSDFAVETAEVRRLAPGLRADFVLLDADALAVPPAQLPRIRVLSTWVDGAPVFTAP